MRKPSTQHRHKSISLHSRARCYNASALGLISLFIGASLSGLLLTAVCALAQSANPATVQVDISQLLNARVVITEKDGQLQMADHALDFGRVSVLITKRAAEISKAVTNTAGKVKFNPLPDSDFFAANARHPDVKLHYAQSDGGPQVRRSPDKLDTYNIPVPAVRYHQMQLFFISAAGPTPLTVKLQYADDTSNLRTTLVPDFFHLPAAGDKEWFVLADDFGKVNLKGQMTEAAHHYIHGFNLDPDPAKTLQQIEITKQNPGPRISVLNLFGATGTLADPHNANTKN